MKKTFLLLFVSLCFLVSPSIAVADYVLPYPSYMPGNKLYKINEWRDRLRQYWYFGEIAGIKYHLQMSDKYLVEAKTLFEYKQYKLASEALEKSDKQFTQAVVYSIDITNHQKDNGSQKNILQEAGVKHTEILEKLDESLPNQIAWIEEKKEREDIPLLVLLSQSKSIRAYANR